MEHLLLKASATSTTDQGQFTAIAAAYTVDRVKDRIIPGAFKQTIERWQGSGKLIPLHWNHEGDPKSIIGSIDPKTMAETDAGLYVEGQLDLGKSEMADEAWRSMKANRMSLSFGYLINDSSRTKDGVNELKDIDLFEVSIVPAPANADTRILSVKSAEELEERAKEIEREDAERTMLEGEPKVPEPEPEPEPQPPAKSLEELGKVAEEVVAKHTNRETPTVDALEAEAPVDPVKVKAEIQRAQEALVALELFEPDEVAGMKSGDLKAVWTAAYINDLPDSAFLYVEGGGSKDSEGKTTPRSLRHFPYKDASGAVDLPHLRNALARIPQSNLSQGVKDQLTAKAQRILDNSKTADGISKEPEPAREVDPLRRQADEVELKFATRDLSLEPAPVKEQPKPQLDDLAQLKQRMHDDMVIHLQGDVEE